MSIREYLYSAYPTLYSVIQQVDTDEVFFESKKVKQHGMTFVIPDNTVCNKINELLHTDDDNANDNILKILSIHLIVKNYDSASQWETQYENSIGRCVKVINATTRTIKLENNVQISLVYKSKNFSIYQAHGGTLPVGERIKLADKNVQTKPKKIISSNSVRIQLYKDVLNSRNVYESANLYSNSIVEYISSAYPDVFTAILPLLDYCAITNFIILFEPSKKSNYFIDNVVINSWWNENKDTLSDTTNTFIYDNIVGLLSDDRDHILAIKQELDELREEIIDCNIVSDVINGIKEAYENMITNNKIGKLSNVLPTETITYLNTHNGSVLKLAQDEIRVQVASNIVHNVKGVLEDVVGMLPSFPQTISKEQINMYGSLMFLSLCKSLSITTYFLYIAVPDPKLYNATPINLGYINIESESVLDMTHNFFTQQPQKKKQQQLYSIKEKKPTDDRLKHAIKEAIARGEQINQDFIDRFDE